MESLDIGFFILFWHQERIGRLVLHLSCPCAAPLSIPMKYLSHALQYSEHTEDVDDRVVPSPYLRSSQALPGSTHSWIRLCFCAPRDLSPVEKFIIFVASFVARHRRQGMSSFGSLSTRFLIFLIVRLPLDGTGKSHFFKSTPHLPGATCANPGMPFGPHKWRFLHNC